MINHGNGDIAKHVYGTSVSGILRGGLALEFEDGKTVVAPRGARKAAWTTATRLLMELDKSADIAAMPFSS